MIKLINILYFILFAASVFGQQIENILWYKQPASKWIEYLLVGNGMMGAVIFCGLEQDILGLKISTLWSGTPDSTNIHPSGKEHLKKIRELLFTEDYDKADQLIGQHLLGIKGNYGTHLPMGSLYFDYNVDSIRATNYRGELDIGNTISSVAFMYEGVKHTCEVLASHSDDLLLIRLAASSDKDVTVNIHFQSEGIPFETWKISENILGIDGDAYESNRSNSTTGVHFFTAIDVISQDGKVIVTHDGIEISKSSQIELRISGANRCKDIHILISILFRNLSGTRPIKIDQKHLSN